MRIVLTPTTIAQIKNIAKYCANPTTVARVMTATTRLKLRVNNTVTQKDLLQKLWRKQVGTREVENARRRLLRFEKSQRNIGFVNYVMQRKVQGAEMQVKHDKKRYNFQLRLLEEKVDNVRIFGEYCKILEEEAGIQLEEQRNKMRQKVNHLEKKYKPWKKEVHGNLKEILIGVGAT